MGRGRLGSFAPFPLLEDQVDMIPGAALAQWLADRAAQQRSQDRVDAAAATSASSRR